MAVPRGPSTRALPLIGAAMLGLAAAGCQHMAVPMDNPWAYDSSSPHNVAMSPSCSAMAQDAVAWGTLPSAWCTPYGFPGSWSRPARAYPFFYGRPHGRTWRGPAWNQYRSHPGRGYGGWRGGRGGRR